MALRASIYFKLICLKYSFKWWFWISGNLPFTKSIAQHLFFVIPVFLFLVIFRSWAPLDGFIVSLKGTGALNKNPYSKNDGSLYTVAVKQLILPLKITLRISALASRIANKCLGRVSYLRMGKLPNPLFSPTENPYLLKAGRRGI